MLALLLRQLINAAVLHLELLHLSSFYRANYGIFYLKLQKCVRLVPGADVKHV